ncbi:MAG: type IV secretion system DNA-binding domain-containing protein [Candidatus Zambryskibacteria bacterium]|nr:type IV secretion system DNA-binding domain-containing protein [Candidatus Zambryskibacteria bacterium]
MPKSLFSKRIEKLSIDIAFIRKNVKFSIKFFLGLSIGFFIIFQGVNILLSSTYNHNLRLFLLWVKNWFIGASQPPIMTSVLFYFKKLCIRTSIISCAIGLVSTVFLVRKSNVATEEVVRGARKADKKTIRNLQKGRIPVGDVTIPVEYENRGTLVLGAAGTGKSVLVRDVIQSLANDKCIIYDRKGEFLQKFYREGDLILNFLDARNVDWNIYEEIKTDEDIDSISSSIVPHTGDDRSKFWYNSARDLIEVVLEAVRRSEVKADFSHLATFMFETNTKEKLFEELKQYKDLISRVEGYISDKSQTATSIFASYTEYANYFRNKALLSSKGGKFSVRDYIKNKEDKRRIFIINPANVESFRGLNTLFLDLAFKEILSLPDDIERRIFVIIDEFPSLYKLDSLERLLAEGRSKGACPLISAQDFTQIERIYEAGAASIFNNANTKAIFRLAETKSAKYISEWLGEQEKKELDESLSQGTAEMRDGYYYKESKKIEKLYLPAEIANLEDLNFVFKVGPYPPYKTKVTYKEYPEVAEGFIPAKIEDKKIGGENDVAMLS